MSKALAELEGGRTLFGDPVSPEYRQKAAQRTRQAYPQHFPDRETALRYLNLIILPPSRRWAFISVGKSASSSALAFLFQAEYGTTLSVDVVPETDINPEAAIHMLSDHRVFERSQRLGLAAADLTGPDGPHHRLCVVRNPLARAVSGFHYLCKSNALKSRWFVGDRFRINAAFGFDWARHPGTVEGFRLFLRYIASEIETVGADRVDGHWRPQVDFIKPQVFRPTLVGRVEALPAFYATLREALDVSELPEQPWKNRQATASDTLSNDGEARRLCAEIYASDYETFGY